ncbi:MAG TPA: LacI family DNA-binding transcriptional regulator [Fervidobacterium sp.]|mgnify:CR=1 FL=1|nr:LacI family DNA-binding transcriptional regulator [Fervidobacterium sp.]HOM74051.1 LacI family DNA-binding transcriptional regulator [Fervidobacterium sp.]HPP17690.1 LacI family DNA-binding transcriptional regulator [Fervidobacterium sp.]
MVKLRDIAEETGYSISTVSKALSGKGRMSEETRNTILSVAKQLGYTPDFYAKSMASKTKILVIGLIVPDITNPFFAYLTRGVERACGETCLLVLMDSFRSLHREEQLIRTARFYGVNGVIVGNSRVNDELIEEISKYVPVVVFDKECKCDNVVSIVVDNYYGAYLATKHLVENGCKNIVHFGGTQELYVSIQRAQGYEAAIKESNLKPHIVRIGYTFDDGYKAAKRLLSEGKHFDGAFCMNDLVALGVMKAIKEEGLKVPEDVAVVGFDDDKQLCEVTVPSLSSVRQPVEMMGETAGKAIIELINGHSNAKKIIFSPSLIVRDSSLRGG